MLTEVRSNGSTSIRLVGQNKIERLAIEEILEANAKGTRINVWADPNWGPPGGSPSLVIELDHEVPTK